MVRSDLAIIFISLASVLVPSLYGMLGSIGFYLHELSQDPAAFDIRTFFIYCFLGAVIGLMVHNIMLDMFNTSYAGVLIASGFSVRRITDISYRYLNLKVKLPNK